MDGCSLRRPSKIGEFFPAKKKWRASVDDLSSSKLDGQTSPNKKRTSASNVASMENAESSSKMLIILDVSASKQREVLENTDQKLCTPGLNKDCSQQTPFALHRCSSNSKDSIGNEALQGSTVKVKCTNKENIVADVATDAGKHENELTKFANDFLSICCSDIITTVTPPSKLSSKAQATVEKGDIESAVDKLGDSDKDTSTIGKKLCDNAATSKQANSIGDCISKKDHFQSSIDFRERSIFTVGQHIDVISTTVDNKTTVLSNVKPPEVLIKTAAAGFSFDSPNPSFGEESASGLLKRRRISIPHTKGSTKQKHQTSRWSSGTSLFSPGDEFWDEAICVVDGLVCDKADDGLNSSVVVEDGRLKNSSAYVNACHIMFSKLSDNAKGYSLQREDRIVLDGSGRRAYEFRGDPLPGLAALARAASSHARVCNEMQEGFQYVNAEVSPLPVRRFDFSDSPDKVDDHENLTSAEKSPCLQHEKGAATGVASSLSATAESLQTESGCYIAKQLEKTPGKTVTQVGYNAETPSIIQQPALSHILEKPDPATQGAAAAVSMPISSTAELKTSLSDWLPGPISSIYARKGLKKLYSWQVDCLQLKGVLEGKNLVYCASTSAGKSLVAEILMLRKVIATGKKALLVLPYVSICSEKAEHLQSVLDPSCKKVSSFFGSQGGGSLPKDTSIAVCTIEKANLLVNKLLEEGRLSELAVVVIDELHMVGDKERGYLLELMLTKLRYSGGEGKDLKDKAHEGDINGAELQIIGMSATMPNAAAVAKWLQAALYETKFRPVPLDEYIKVANLIYDKNMNVIRTMRKGADLAGKDPDHVVELCHEVVQEGHSVLLFCSSRKACETSAKHVTKFLPAHELILLNTTPGPETAAIALEELQKCPAGLDPVLAETIPKGVAYHHAGLTVEEREIVEACYRSGVVRILTATSTLAAGVNLPARRVIFRQPKIGNEFVDGTRYRQMAGRAGRAGIDTRGESILICKPEELKRMYSLLNEECQPLMSCLADDKKGMTRAILEVVAGGVVQSALDVERYVKCTLLNSTQSFQEVVKSAQDSLRWLCQHKFLEWDQTTELYSCTPLGKAAFGSSLSPEESLFLSK